MSAWGRSGHRALPSLALLCCGPRVVEGEGWGWSWREGEEGENGVMPTWGLEQEPGLSENSGDLMVSPFPLHPLQPEPG